MKLIDTHFHPFSDKYQSTLDEIIRGFFEYGGKALICVSTDINDSKQVLDIIGRYDNVFGAVGVHPHDALTYNDSCRQLIIDNLSRVVAIGEIGLDYHYDYSPRDIQRNVFRAQLQLASEYHMPVIMHCREAYGDFVEILRDYNVRGVVHCYSGSVETAVELVKMGFVIGIGGSYTFRNSKKLKEVVATIGLNNIILETDSPYMTPEPLRGQVNIPQNTYIVAQSIAIDLDVAVDTVLDITYDNAVRLFGLEIK